MCDIVRDLIIDTVYLTNTATVPYDKANGKYGKKTGTYKLKIVDTLENNP